MARTYYIYAGKDFVEEFEVSSTDTDFFDFISLIKSNLSSEAKAAFTLVNEYDFDDDEPGFPECTDGVYSEIENAIYI
jgi:hypothetical protein